jgi:predicted anti-sigma-YlaC factor YlaD
MRHLDEEEVQAYLDGGETLDGLRVTLHLQECPACRRMYEEYRTLYAVLVDESHVCAPLPAAEERKRGRVADMAEALIGASALTSALVVASVILVGGGGLRSGAGLVAGALWQLLRRAAGLLVFAGHPLTGQGLEPGAAAVVAVAVLAASGFFALDYLLLQPRLRGKTP